MFCDIGLVDQCWMDMLCTGKVDTCSNHTVVPFLVAFSPVPKISHWGFQTQLLKSLLQKFMV